MNVLFCSSHGRCFFRRRCRRCLVLLVLLVLFFWVKGVQCLTFWMSFVKPVCFFLDEKDLNYISVIPIVFLWVIAVLLRVLAMSNGHFAQGIVVRL